MIDPIFGTAGAVGGMVWWLRSDGPVRLWAGLVAVGHRDSVRRRDAREVLLCTGRNTKPALTAPSQSQRHNKIGSAAPGHHRSVGGRKPAGIAGRRQW
ncbi:hypothetical protein OHB26_39575 (plasmid) [Nocardia sp. NBC_01503]|uniref:hypothetical protein n=1 Tax=Nocardia sp. NBC_01503 TaxID=2975997 RepID=UPI002E7B8ABF|nr:hypothetical protein [Nocardia sp. NBC_01503]WTL36668.1 hypothetical protein OHB26_39000 [Nocardia sp. NBC_01503]WTL36779.1 hypothetical protein OHB26_39575 [Nocardia sp. NBC_01503]